MPLPFCVSPYRGVSSAVYVVAVGSLFYLGSSKRLAKRLTEHRSLLKRGKHWCSRLQEAYAVGEKLVVGVVQAVPESADRPSLFAAEQQWLDVYFDHPNCVNQSREAASNSLFPQTVYRMMLDPVVWAKQLEHLARVRPPSTRESRMKNAELALRRGSQQPCEVKFPDGNVLVFASVTGAAKHLGVQETSLTKWISGRQPWPGTGKNRIRRPLAHLLGVRARLIPCPEEKFLGDFLGRCVEFALPEK